MAKQHFYSRVPAKVSMFNRADSFDTFACSEDISADFIAKNLGAICDNKLTAEESAYLRTQQLQPVFHQFCCRTGELVQSCTSYMKLDYTGERSAYLVHNLVYDEEEKERILCTLDNDLVNPDLFETDIDKFCITSPDAVPVRDYPHLDYAPKAAATPRWIAERYDANMLKRFIYATLSTVCGKLKSVFFVMGEGDTSLEALAFLNGILQIFPYHLRKEISFVTRVSDSTRFASFSLKCVPSVLTNIPPTRGATLDFRTKLAVGIKDEDVNQQLSVVEFFYGLLLNDAVRREFLLCCDRAVGSVSSLGQLSFKALGDLVFVFRSTSGMFDEKVILPSDDKLLEFFTIYEKARGALSDEYRINAAKSLQRYPDNHQEIPKLLFAKIGKIYPGEIAATKRVIMGVVLELIHTDIMREKLFTFIKNNYEGEDEQTKSTICQDLARVYYGGFLQPQILTFFGNTFASSDPATRDIIAQKVLLTVRTKAISASVVQFFKTQYEFLSEDSKAALYKTVLENLPDGDALAADLLAMVSEVWAKEEESVREQFVQKLLKAIENEQRRSERPLLRLLAQKGGAFGIALDKKMIEDWYGRKCFAEYVGYKIAPLAQNARVQWLIDLWQNNPDISPDATRELTVAVVASQEANPVRCDVTVLWALEEQVLSTVGHMESPSAQAFADMYAKQVLQPLVAASLLDVFRHVSEEGVVAKAVAYVGDHPALANARYEVLVAYMDLKAGLVSHDKAAVVEALDAIPQDKTLRAAIVATLNADLAREEVEPNTLVRCAVCNLKTGGWGFADEYVLAQEEVGSSLNPKLNAKKANWLKQTVALKTVMEFVNSLYAVCSDKARAELVGDQSGLRDMFGSFLATWDKKGVKDLAAVLHTLSPKNNDFVVACRAILNALRPAKKPLF